MRFGTIAFPRLFLASCRGWHSQWYSCDALMTAACIDRFAAEGVLYLTTIGRVTGEPREIEIWFIVHRGSFYLFAEKGEAAGWVKNIRRNPKVIVRIGDHRKEAVARVLDYQTDRHLWDEVQASAYSKYGWGGGLPVALTPVA